MMFSYVQAQEVVSTYEIKEKVRNRVQSIQYQSNDSLFHTLLIDKKSLIKLDYDQDLQVTGEHLIEIPKRREYSHTVGQVVTENDLVQIYYANDRNNKFAILEINPQSNTAELREVDLKLKRQTFLHGFTNRSRFYVLSLDLDNNLLLYEFNGTQFTSSSFNVANLEYKNDSRSYTYSIATALKSGLEGSIGDSQLAILEENLPNSIELVASEAKFIKRGERIYISIDLDDKRTDVLEISLIDKTIHIESYNYPQENFDFTDNVKSNSYLHENKLYQLIVSKEAMNLSVTDLATKKEIKRLEVQRDDDLIPFANTPIIQLGGAYDNYRELSSSKKFLRKMVNSFPGISVHRIGNQLEITIGGSKETQGDIGVAILSAVAVGAVMSSGNADVFVGYNPFFDSYVSDSNSKSVYVVGLFNDDFNHMIGDISYNVWDNINYFTEPLNPKHENITLYKGAIYYSYYDSGDDNYYLVRF